MAIYVTKSTFQKINVSFLHDGRFIEELDDHIIIDENDIFGEINKDNGVNNVITKVRYRPL